MVGKMKKVIATSKHHRVQHLCYKFDWKISGRKAKNGKPLGYPVCIFWNQKVCRISCRETIFLKLKLDRKWLCLVPIKLSDRAKRTIQVSCHLSECSVPSAVWEMFMPRGHPRAGRLDCDRCTTLHRTHEDWLLVQGEGRMTRCQKAGKESKTMFSTLILQKVTETPSKGITNESLLSNYMSGTFDHFTLTAILWRKVIVYILQRRKLELSLSKVTQLASGEAGIPSQDCVPLSHYTALFIQPNNSSLKFL